MKHTVPATLGYHLPAEWERHEATWLAWPHNHQDWPGKFAPIPWVYCDIIRNLAQVERVNLVVKNPSEQSFARVCLEKAGVNLSRVTFHTIPTNRVWLRDSGPTFLKNAQGKAMVDWQFNAWAKYPNHLLDNKVPEVMNKETKYPRFVPYVHIDGKARRVVMEGGAFDGNGRGTLLTTEECLLSTEQERNPGMTREDYEAVFASFLGISNVIWLGRGIEGDDTHGHVDDLARFVDHSTVVTVVEKNVAHNNYAPLRDNLKRLKAARDERGRQLNVVELPMPRPLTFEGTVVPASYANFYIANKLVLVPTFNDPADREALKIISELFPGRDVVGIHSVDLVWGFGTLHCMTQQEPA